MKKDARQIPRRAVDGLKAAARVIPKPLHRPLRIALISGAVFAAVYALFISSCAFAIYHRGTRNAVTTVAERIFPYPAAVIDHEVIPLSRFRLEVDARMHYAQARNLDADLPTTEKAVMDQLIDRTLYAHELAKAGITVSDADTDAKMQEIYTQVGSKAQLQSFLQDNYGSNIGVPEFRRWVKESLIEAAVKQQLLQHASVSHILIAVPSDADAATVEAARLKAVDIKSKINADTPFDTVAKQFSEDVASRDKAGALGVTVRGDTDPIYSADFQNAVFTLPVNQVSDPVRSPYGWHLIMVTQRSGTVQESLKQFTDSLWPGNVRAFIGE